MKGRQTVTMIGWIWVGLGLLTFVSGVARFFFPPNNQVYRLCPSLCDPLSRISYGNTTTSGQLFRLA
jgi:hypothetical protein